MFSIMSDHRIIQLIMDSEGVRSGTSANTWPLQHVSLLFSTTTKVSNGIALSPVDHTVIDGIFYYLLCMETLFSRSLLLAIQFMACLVVYNLVSCKVGTTGIDFSLYTI